MPTIMIRHATDEQVELAKSLTYEKSASQAFVRCVVQAARYRSEVDRLTAQISDLSARLAVAEQVIERARQSASDLLVYVAQGDLLSDR